jgi:hypothetical protein
MITLRVIGHQFIADTKKPARGGLVCLAGYAYGWAANSTTMKAYMMGSAINAPNNALNISSFVMLKFKTFIRGTCRAEHLVCGKQYNGF